MTRARVRGFISKDELDRMYAEPWDFEGYGTTSGSKHDHLANCPDFWIYWGMQIEFGKGFGKVASIADLSCGDARITKAVAEHSGVTPVLGDYASGYQLAGPLNETIESCPRVDLFICTNTLEHLDDPDRDLKLIREKCDQLFTSASLDEHADAEGDHYWTWSREDVEDMLHVAGFEVSAYAELDMTPYWYPHSKFGMWACR